jgi:hypothetical protein
MRFVIAVVVVCGLIAWLVASRTPAGPGINPRPGDVAALDNAAAAGKLHQDPERRVLRQSILDAANRVEASPCDPQRRREMVQAATAFNALVTHSDPSEIETYALNDGTLVRTSHYFNDVVRDAMGRADGAHCDIGGATDRTAGR